MSDIIANLWLCEDCTIGNVNEGETIAYRVNGNTFPCETSPDFDTETEYGFREFHDSRCDNCGTDLAGHRFRFAVWAWL